MQITFTDRLFRRRATESSAFSLPVSFWDDSTETWTAETPSTVSYRIDRDNQPIKDWTTVTPASSVTLSITSTDNAIQDDCNDSENRQVTVRANTGTGQTQNVFVYQLKNLSGQS